MLNQINGFRTYPLLSLYSDDSPAASDAFASSRGKGLFLAAGLAVPKLSPAQKLRFLNLAATANDDVELATRPMLRLIRGSAGAGGRASLSAIAGGAMFIGAMAIAATAALSIYEKYHGRDANPFAVWGNAVFRWLNPGDGMPAIEPPKKFAGDPPPPDETKEEEDIRRQIGFLEIRKMYAEQNGEDDLVLSLNSRIERLASERAALVRARLLSSGRPATMASADQESKAVAGETKATGPANDDGDEILREAQDALRQLEQNRDGVTIWKIAGFIPRLDADGRRPLVAAIIRELDNPNFSLAEQALLALRNVVMRQLWPEERREVARDIASTVRMDGFNASNPDILASGVAPFLEYLDREELLALASNLKRKLRGEHNRARFVLSLAINADVIPYLPRGERLSYVEAMEVKIGKRLNLYPAIHNNGGILDKAAASLEARDRLMRIFLPPRLIQFSELATRNRAIAVLNDHGESEGNKIWAIHDLSLSYTNTLSPGAQMLLIMKGLRILLGEDSLLLFDTDDESGASGPVSRNDPPLGTRLHSMAEEALESEQLLTKYPTIGGKLRDVELNPLALTPIPVAGRLSFHIYDYYGFLTGNKLTEEEQPPVLLWPVRDPNFLTETIWELLTRSGEIGPQEFKLSVGISGEVGDDLKPAALVVHALAPVSYPFPITIQPIATRNLKWFAPVMEGGVRGPMSHIEMDGDGPFRKVPDRVGRYDHVFLRFLFPPRPEYFSSSPADDPWQTHLQRFLEDSQPEILEVNAPDRSIFLSLTMDGEKREALWQLAGSDWDAIVTTMSLAEGGGERVVRVNEEEFGRHLFLEYARAHFFEAINRVVNAAWVLGMLREVSRDRTQNGAFERARRGIRTFLGRKDGGDVIPFARGFTADKREALERLSQEFESRFTELLRTKELERILRTRWVGNKRWPRIRYDMTLYQDAMAADPQWRESIQELGDDVIVRAREILELP